MQKHAALIAIIAVIIYGVYNARTCTKTPAKQPVNSNHTQHVKGHTSSSHAQEELTRISAPAYTLRYIIEIINHGSQNLHFKKDEVMEAGFASHEDAPKIAAYVMQLRGESANKAETKDGAMFFTSICGGCHGNDAKGISGAYPDLTRQPLLGIEQRKRFLTQRLKQEN
jgi:mono/diheme cytochrome c family protein